MNSDDHDVFVVAPEDRAKAHALLDAWLDEAGREAARAFDSGHSGYVGAISLSAYVKDEGISLHVERFFEVDL